MLRLDRLLHRLIPRRVGLAFANDFDQFACQRDQTTRCLGFFDVLFCQAVIRVDPLGVQIPQIVAHLLNLGVTEPGQVVPDIRVRASAFIQGNSRPLDEFLDQMVGGVVGTADRAPAAGLMSGLFQKPFREE
jgi:hypothetical protein